MKKILGAATTSLILAGCGGEVSNFDTLNIVGRSFSQEASGINVDLGAGGGLANQNLSVYFGSEDSATVSLGGSSVFLTRQEDGSYEDFAGNNLLYVATLLTDGPVTPDMLYFSLFTSDSATSIDTLFFVDGNRTSVSNLPSSAATYTGVVKTFDQNIDLGEGTITLNVDFAGGLVGGQIDGAVPGNTAAALTIDEASFSGSNFATTLSSADVSITSSQIDGQFFGSSGDQVGGDLSLEAPGQYIAGYYGATN